MNKKGVFRSLKWVGIIVLGSLLTAGCKHHHGKHGSFMFDMIAYKLDMTDEQEVKWYAVRDEITRLRDEAKQERYEQMQTLIDMVNADTLDQQQALALVEQHREKMAAAAPSVIAKLADFHATLSGEQKAKIVKKISSHRDELQP